MAWSTQERPHFNKVEGEKLLPILFSDLHIIAMALTSLQLKTHTHTQKRKRKRKEEEKKWSKAQKYLYTLTYTNESKRRPGMGHTYNLSIWEAEAGKSLQVPNQPKLYT